MPPQGHACLTPHPHPHPRPQKTPPTDSYPFHPPTHPPPRFDLAIQLGDMDTAQEIADKLDTGARLTGV